MDAGTSLWNYTAKLTTTNIETLNLNNLDKITSISKNVLCILKFLDETSNKIIKKVNNKYFDFYRDSCSRDVAPTNIKKLDSYRKATLKRIKDITQVIWDDYADFASLSGNIVVDAFQYNAEKEEYDNLKEKGTFDVLIKCQRRFITVQNRIEKNIMKFNNNVQAFKNLDNNLRTGTIAYTTTCKDKRDKETCASSVNSYLVITELESMINDCSIKASRKTMGRFNPYLNSYLNFK